MALQGINGGQLHGFRQIAPCQDLQSDSDMLDGYYDDYDDDEEDDDDDDDSNYYY